MIRLPVIRHLYVNLERWTDGMEAQTIDLTVASKHGSKE